MNFNIYTTDFFDKDLKKLAKKYPSIKNEFKALVDSLKEKPTLGSHSAKVVTKSVWLLLQKVKARVAAAV